MKATITLLAIFLISISSFAQQAINYKALIKDDLGNVITNDLVQIQFNILKGTGQVNVYSETHTPTTDENGLIIVNLGKGALVSGSANFDTIEWDTDNHFLEVLINIGNGFTNMGITEFMTVPYALSAANVSGLEKITENANTGWRFKGEDPSYHGDIGNQAVDLSTSQNESELYGASGSGAFASGYQTQASGSYSVAMGRNTVASRANSAVFGAYNVENSSSIFAVGNGYLGFDNPNRKNALTLNVGAGNALDFIIGNHEIDDDPTSQNDDIKFFFSGQYGAFRAGKVSNESGDEWNLDNIGFYSTAFGSGTIASGGQSFAAGNSTNASAYTSTALGLGTIASSTSSMAIGAYNIDDNEAQFMVGIGSNNTARNSAFVVKKNGAVLAPSFELSEIIDDNALITKEYYDLNTIIGINDLTDGKSDADGSSLFLGINAGAIDDGSGNKNVGIGFNVLSSNTTGSRNTATGNGALIDNIDGILNTAIGSNALLVNTSGNRNTAIGTSAGFNNISGDNNVFIGFAAGSVNTSAESNRLYINNSQSSFPLIYGEFDTDLIRIHGTLEVTQDVNLSGDLDVEDKINTNEINSVATGTSNLIPIAYGTVESNANVLSGTGNFTASISSDVITISVNDVALSHYNTSCLITPYSTSFRTSSIIISGGNLQVRSFNSSGSLVPVTFQFVIYKK
ncbi:hypothetical protein [Psychroserpens damuponensis]|uniref:hypothetical protein n=1 Tax=Psychroserpens damuponensis TaxID=943936 RepID=UPI00058E0285|nr:hypothetical protein [Psychroserpens damuponensis]